MVFFLHVRYFLVNRIKEIDMLSSNKINPGIAQLLVVLFVLVGHTNIQAADHSLECKLYVASSLSDETNSSVNLEKVGLSMSSSRNSGYCVFADGGMADKQFVVIDRVPGDGSTGSVLGFSVYTMEGGDSVSVEFTGGWGKEGFKGLYTVIGGTGTFENAKGDGSFTGSQSAWDTTGVFDVVMNLTTP